MYLKSFLWQSLKTRLTLLTLLLFVVSIWAIAIYSDQTLREDMQRMLYEQQFSTVTRIAKEIDSRLADRKQALEMTSKHISPELLASKSALQAFLEQREFLERLFNGGIFITNADGTAVADLPISVGRIGTNYLDRDSVAIPLREGKSIIGRPAMGKKLGGPIFSITAPIFDSKGKAVGTIVGTINLGKPNFLDQIAQAHSGKSGSYLLIALKHQIIVAATDKSRVMNASPGPGVNAMYDRYVQGYEGFGTALSSRGVIELSAAKQIPIANWLIVGALPATEAFEPIDHMLHRLFAGAVVVTLLACGIGWWLISCILRMQFAPMLAARGEIEHWSNGAPPIKELPVHRNDEIGQLITGFNAMLLTYAKRQDTLAASESFKDTVLNSLDAEIVVVDRQGVICAVNARWHQFSAKNCPEHGNPTSRTGVGTSYFSVFVEDPSAEVAEISDGVLAVLEGRVPRFTIEYSCHSSRQKRWFLMNVVPLGLNAIDGAVIAHTDITERKQVELKLQLAASVFTEAREGIIITGADGTILDVNAAFTRITGYSTEEAVGNNPRMLQSSKQDKSFYEALWNDLLATGHWSGEIWNKSKCGQEYAELLTISAVRDANGNTQQFVALFSDITSIKENQKKLEHIAHFDSLTQLPNRVLLADRLQQALHQTIRRGRGLAVVYLDLDGFKLVNDLHGHDVGDQLLIKLSASMKATLREGDTLARIGGDEFVAVLGDLEGNGNASCVHLLNRLLEAASEKVQIGDLVIQVSASVGVTFCPQNNELQADQLLRQADQAMYQAKAAGKNRFQIFDAAQDRIRNSQFGAGI